MARKLVLTGPAAEAVERLARSAGMSPAELIKRALRREDEAQRSEAEKPVNSAAMGPLASEVADIHSDPAALEEIRTKLQQVVVDAILSADTFATGPPVTEPSPLRYVPPDQLRYTVGRMDASEIPPPTPSAQ